MGWETALLTVLGGFLASLSGLLVEWWRESRRLRDRHFEDIKRNCLEPILEELSRLRRYFEFSEGGPRWSVSSIEESLRSEIRWWELFSFRDVDKLLYEDLRNHYPDIYEGLENVKVWVRTRFAEYLQAIRDLLKVIEEDPDFKSIEEEFKRSYGEVRSST